MRMASFGRLVASIAVVAAAIVACTGVADAVTIVVALGASNTYASGSAFSMVFRRRMCYG